MNLTSNSGQAVRVVGAPVAGREGAVGGPAGEISDARGASTW